MSGGVCVLMWSIKLKITLSTVQKRLAVVYLLAMSQNFFTASIGGYILRGTNPIFVKNYEMAMALFNLQDEHYKFSPVMKVHKSELVCTSCES